MTFAKSDFYRRFEDRYRGSREAVYQGLEVYKPWLEALSLRFDTLRALDLGCGRGEWLEFLQNHCIAAQGVDQDVAMLEACTARGLSVVQDDLLEVLKQTPTQHYALVSVLHVAEHLSFAQLEYLMAECFRVLQDGGLLIIETPNPENLRVASCNFYLDPSHQKPIPPALLEFLSESIGFERKTIVRMHEPEHLHRPQQLIGLEEVLAGVSPDYALIAQKCPGNLTPDPLKALFMKTYGVDLDQLMGLHQIHLESRLQQLHEIATRAEQGALRANHFIDQIKATRLWKWLRKVSQFFRS